MRAILVSMVAGAGLLVSACGGTETPAAVNNTVTEELPVENAGVTDNMVTEVDGANAVAPTNTVEANTTVTNAAH